MDLSQTKSFGKAGSRPPKKEVQLRFLRRLLRLFENGYPIIEALEMLEWDEQLQSISSSVIQSLKAGCPLDEALEHIHFNHIITDYLYLVRHNGDLSANIEKGIQMFEQRLLSMKKLKETTRYPAILFMIFALLLYFVKQSVLPSFINLFHNSPDSASIVMTTMTIIDVAGQTMTALVIMAAAGFLIWRFIRKNIAIEKRIRLVSKIPVYRQYKKMEVSFLFASHLSSLLTTGLSMRDILMTMSQQQKQPILSYYASLLTEELSKGIYITSLLFSLPLIDKQMAAIFQRNADKEALEKDLSVYAEFQMEEMHRKIMKIITYIQPVLFCLLAGFIVFIYIALMWPMFQLINTI